jgi:hypothetical protein
MRDRWGSRVVGGMSWVIGSVGVQKRMMMLLGEEEVLVVVEERGAGMGTVSRRVR